MPPAYQPSTAGARRGVRHLRETCDGTDYNTDYNTDLGCKALHLVNSSWREEVVVLAPIVLEAADVGFLAAAERE